MKRSSSRNQQDINDNNQISNPYNQPSQQLNYKDKFSNYQNFDSRAGGLVSNLSLQRFNQTTSNPSSHHSSQNQLQRKADVITNNTGYVLNQKQISSQTSRQDLYKTSTQQREEIRELMGQIEMPDDSLTISSLSQSPWNAGKSRQRMSQTNGTNEASNSNDNDGTLGRSEILEGTYEDNKSLQITRRQNQTSYIEDVDISSQHNHNNSQNEYDYSQHHSNSQIIDQDQTQSDLYQSRQEKFKRRVAASPDDLEDSQVHEQRGRNSPDFNRGEHELDISHNGGDDLMISNTLISNTNTTYRAALMTENQNTRRIQNRTFADSVINQGLNQLTSSSNNNTHRNNYSSNQDTHRNSGRNRLSNRNRTTTLANGRRKEEIKSRIEKERTAGIKRRRNQDESHLDDNLRSDVDESESEDINRGIQEQSDDDYDEEVEEQVENDVSPPPNRRWGGDSRSRSNNNRFNDGEQDHNLDSSEFSNVDSFAQTQYSKLSRMGKSKMMFGKVKGDDLDLIEDEQSASMIKKSPNVLRFRNMADNESLSLTPASIEGQWQNQKSIIQGNNRAINRTLAVENKNPLSKVVNATNLNTILSNNQNINSLNMTELESRAHYNVTQTLFGNGAGNSNASNKHHLSSLQRDQELEQALEEDSQINYTINKTTLTNSGGTNNEPPLRQSKQVPIKIKSEKPENQGDSNGVDFRKVKYENIQLQVEVKKASVTIRDLADQLEQSDLQKNQLMNQVRDYDIQLKDVKEHLQLLKQKYTDDPPLSQLRGRHLEQAKKEIINLNRNLEIKIQELQKAEKTIQAKDREDQVYSQVYESQIRQLIQEIETLRILNESLKRDVTSNKGEVQRGQEDQRKLRQDFQIKEAQLIEEQDQKLRQIQIEYESIGLESQKSMQEMEKRLKQMDKHLNQRDQKIEEDSDVIEQKELIIQDIERENQKIAIELANFKERCKDLENEMEHIRGSAENSGSILMGNQSVSYAGKGNTTLGGLNQTRATNYDFEVKKMKDMYSQQLNKAKEESSKYRQQAKDLEFKLRLVEEESSKKYQQSITSTSEQIEKDQRLINELQKTNQRLNTYIQLEEDIRDIFNIDSKEDLYQKLLGVREDQEMKLLLETELAKLQNQLKEAQNRELELIDNQNKLIQSQNQKQQKSTDGGGMSNFTKTLLINKEKEIDNLRQQYEREKKSKMEQQDQIWRLNDDLKSLTLTNQELELSTQELSRELGKVRDSKEKAEKNVDELKEKMRELIREHAEKLKLQQLESQQNQFQAKTSSYLDEVERKKYDELINMILELELARDPLNQLPNLSLQDSFIDEFEQACKHLNEQIRLVKVQSDGFSKEIQAKNDQVKQLQTDANSHLQTIEQSKRELFRLQDVIKDKERQVEIVQTEQEELHKTCERFSLHIREVEDLNSRLRSENEELNINFRKLMRAQEHLHKGNDKSKILNQSTSTNLNKSSLNSSTLREQQQRDENIVNQQELDRLQIEYENKLSQAEIQINLLQKQLQSVAEQNQAQDLIVLREQYREEVIELLDSLIDSNTKQQLTITDLGLKLIKRIERVRLQERSKIQLIHNEQTLNSNILDQGKDNILTSSQLSQQTQSKPSHASLQEEPRHLQKSNLLQSVSVISPLVENFKQEVLENVNNENELLQSINKWLRLSGNGQQQLQDLQQQQNLFRNFFTNDDQNSLMLSELITKPQLQIPQQQQQTDNSYIISLEQRVKEKEEQIRELQLKVTDHIQGQTQNLQQIDSLQSKILRLEDDLRQKESSLRQLEEQYEFKNREVETEAKSRSQVMWKEVEALKDQIKQELQNKSEQLETEYEELEKQKAKCRQQLMEQQKDQERQFQAKMEQQEREFRDKLKAIEVDIKSGCEKNKEEQITSLCKQLEEQYQIRLKAQGEEMQQQIQLLKAEHNSKMEESKRLKERESKKQKEEVEKIKKQQEDKAKKIEIERITEKECWEREQKDKIDQLTVKSKKDLKAAQEKLRAELRNQIDQIKNEMVKQKADFEREKKKLLSDHESNCEQLKRDFEEQLEKELKLQKDKQEKLIKKRVDEKQQEMQRKIEDMDLDMQKVREIHQQELRKEKERLEIRLREQLRGEVKLEVHDELEIEFKEQLDMMRVQQSVELDKLRTKYDLMIREERASMLPATQDYSRATIKQINELRNVEVQCELVLESNRSNYQQEQQQTTNYINTSQNSSNTNNRKTYDERDQQFLSNSLYVEQLKNNFEEELERQQQLFEMQLVTKQNSSVRVFEELMVLEFDKILQSIYFKSSSASSLSATEAQKGIKTTKESKQMDLEKKRNEINKLIADILNRNDDRQEKQMRKSLENLKRKVSEVLKVFKTELEAKLNKKHLEIQVDNNKNPSKQLKERLKLPIAQNQIINNDLNDLVSEQTSRTQQQMQQQQYQQNRYQRQQVNGIMIYGGDDISEIQSSQDQDFQSEYYQTNIDGVNDKVDSLPNSHLPTPRNLDIEQKKLNRSDQKAQKQNLLSDIKQYVQEEQQDNNILKKVSPVVNTNGVLVVEVDKVVRDLKMLQQTIKISKFYRLLQGCSDDSNLQQSTESNQADQQQRDSDSTLQQYRQLLNELFKLIAKLNQGVESLSKQSEVYKLKLFNAELRDKLSKYENENERNNAALIVEQILNAYHKMQSQMGDRSQRCLNVLESTQLSINKLQFKLYQVIELFKAASEQGEYEMDLDLVEQKCGQYLIQNPNDQLQLDNLLQSTYSPEKQPGNNTQKIQPEFLSPEETAQLVANVFSKLNQTHTTSNNQQAFKKNTQNLHMPGLTSQLDSYQSFFNTFLSNDEYIKNADNFIQKYREQMNFTKQRQQQSNNNLKMNRTNTAMNLPLQQINHNDNLPLRYNQTQGGDQIGLHRQYQSVQLNNLQNKKRSRSQSNHGLGSSHNHSMLTQQPYYLNNQYAPLQINNQNNSISNPSQTYMSNVFQKGSSDNMHSISIHTQNPSLFQPNHQISQNENFNHLNMQNYRNNQPYQSPLGNQDDNLCFQRTNNNNQSTFTRTGDYYGMTNQSVSHSYNGNPWIQHHNQSLPYQYQQTNDPKNNYNSSISNNPAMLIVNNQNETSQSLASLNHLARQKSQSGSIQRGRKQSNATTGNYSIGGGIGAGELSVIGQDQVSQAQHSVNAMFEKLKNNYQSSLNATKNQSFN